MTTADLTTCSVEGLTSLQTCEELASDADTITFDTYTKCAEAMNDGRVDALTPDGAILFGLVYAFVGFEIVGEEFSDEPYGGGIPAGATDLRQFSNERICQIQESVRLRRVLYFIVIYLLSRLARHVELRSRKRYGASKIEGGAVLEDIDALGEEAAAEEAVPQLAVSG